MIWLEIVNVFFSGRFLYYWYNAYFVVSPILETMRNRHFWVFFSLKMYQFVTFRFPRKAIEMMFPQGIPYDEKNIRALISVVWSCHFTISIQNGWKKNVHNFRLKMSKNTFFTLLRVDKSIYCPFWVQKREVSIITVRV